MNSFKVLSYNIHKGFAAGNTKLVLDQIREQIREVGADIVLLQEVVGLNESHDKKIETWPKVSQFEFLADSAWSHFAYGRNAIYSEGHHGNAILSKFPFVHWDNINISTNSLESRGVIHGVVKLLPSEEELHLFCIHLGLFESAREKQSEYLSKRIKEHVPPGEAYIIGGDFNDWRGRMSTYLGRSILAQEAFKIKTGQHAKTFPAYFPVLRLDRIYFGNLDLKSCEVLQDRKWRVLSDHLPLLAEFEKLK